MRYLLLLALVSCGRADAHPHEKQEPCVTVPPPPPELGAGDFEEPMTEAKKQEILDKIHARRRWMDTTWMSCGPEAAP